MRDSRFVFERSTLRSADIARLRKHISLNPKLRMLLLSFLRPTSDPSTASKRRGPAADDLVIDLLEPTQLSASRPEILKILGQWCDSDLLEQHEAWRADEAWRFRAVVRLVARLGDTKSCNQVLGLTSPLMDARHDAYAYFVRDALQTAAPCATPTVARASALRALTPPAPTGRKLQEAFLGADPESCQVNAPLPDTPCDSLPLAAAQILASRCDEEVIAAARRTAASPARTISAAGACLLARCVGREATDNANGLRDSCPKEAAKSP